MKKILIQFALVSHYPYLYQPLGKEKVDPCEAPQVVLEERAA